MISYPIGGFVKSLAGRDKDDFFIILKENSEYVYLVDGKYRTLDKPKRKNKKHVQVIHHQDEALSRKLLNRELVINEDVKRALALYKREGQVV